MKFLLILNLALSLCAFARHTKTYKANHHKKHHKGLIKKKLLHTGKPHQFLASDVTVPKTLDLRPKLTAIRDQGQCGSCWMHSTTAVHRDGYAIDTKNTQFQALSEQDMDCVTTESGCNGGYFDAFDFMKKGGKGLGGQHSASAVPYTARDGRCKTTIPVVSHITDWHMLGNGSSVSAKDIMVYMSAVGKPVSITVAAGAGDWENYSGGVYNGCAMAGTDHMINIVGFDCESSVDAAGNCKFGADGNLPPGVGTWILRNSWGTGWGDKGWMVSKITDSRGRKCNAVAEEAAYAEFDSQPAPGPTPDPTPVPVPPAPTPAPECHGFGCRVFPSLPWCVCK